MSAKSSPKAKGLADGIEVWCSYDKLAEIDQLEPNPRNPNTHPVRQVELLAKNIRYFGWRHPISVSKQSGKIVAGHGRLEAAKHLGLQLVPVDYQDFASDSDELATVIADNRLAELASLDLNSLEDIINELQVEEDFALDLTGFEKADLDDLLGDGGGADLSGDPEHPDDEELDKSDVVVAVGQYRMTLKQETYLKWLDELKQKAGFDKEAVLAEIKRRLEL